MKIMVDAPRRLRDRVEESAFEVVWSVFVAAALAVEAIRFMATGRLTVPSPVPGVRP